MCKRRGDKETGVHRRKTTSLNFAIISLSMGSNEGERGGETRVEILKNSINYGILYLLSVYRVRKFQISSFQRRAISHFLANSTFLQNCKQSRFRSRHISGFNPTENILTLQRQAINQAIKESSTKQGGRIKRK